MARRGRDQGDDATVSLPDGRLLSVEAKDQKRFTPAAWIDQATSQQRVAGSIPVVIAKRRRRSDPAEGYVLMTLADFASLAVGRGFGKGVGDSGADLAGGEIPWYPRVFTW